MCASCGMQFLCKDKLLLLLEDNHLHCFRPSHSSTTKQANEIIASKHLKLKDAGTPLCSQVPPDDVPYVPRQKSVISIDLYETTVTRTLVLLCS